MAINVLTEGLAFGASIARLILDGLHIGVAVSTPFQTRFDACTLRDIPLKARHARASAYDARFDQAIPFNARGD